MGRCQVAGHLPHVEAAPNVGDERPGTADLHAQRPRHPQHDALSSDVPGRHRVDAELPGSDDCHVGVGITIDDGAIRPQSHVGAARDAPQIERAGGIEGDHARRRGGHGVAGLDVHAVDHPQRDALRMVPILDERAGRERPRSGAGVQRRVELLPEACILVVLRLELSRSRAARVAVEAVVTLELHEHDVARHERHDRGGGAGAVPRNHLFPEIRIAVVSRAEVDVGLGILGAVRGEAHPDDVAGGRARQELLVGVGEAGKPAREVERLQAAVAPDRARGIVGDQRDPRADHVSRFADLRRELESIRDGPLRVEQCEHALRHRRRQGGPTERAGGDPLGDLGVGELEDEVGVVGLAAIRRGSRLEAAVHHLRRFVRARRVSKSPDLDGGEIRRRIANLDRDRARHAVDCGARAVAGQSDVRGIDHDGVVSDVVGQGRDARRAAEEDLVACREAVGRCEAERVGRDRGDGQARRRGRVPLQIAILLPVGVVVLRLR